MESNSFAEIASNPSARNANANVLDTCSLLIGADVADANLTKMAMLFTGQDTKKHLKVGHLDSIGDNHEIHRLFGVVDNDRPTGLRNPTGSSCGGWLYGRQQERGSDESYFL